MPSLLHVALVAVLGCMVFASADADTQPFWTPLPLCEIGKGFAGEFNYQFSLIPDVETDPAKNEAIVIAIRPVPYDPRMGPVDAVISAKFNLRGVPIPMLSDSDGIIVIKDTIPKGTVINLEVSNQRIDGSTPFAVYSYVANRPHCFLSITPSSLFYGPIPSAVGDPPQAAKSYFVAYPPEGAAASFFTLFLDGGPQVSITYADSVDKIKQKSGTIPLTMGEKPWNVANPVFFEVSPVNIGSNTVIVKGTIQWRVLMGTTLSTPSIEPSNIPAGSATKAKGSGVEANAAGASIGLYFALIFLGICGYFTSRSIYNYRIKEITNFPMFIPHHSFFTMAVTSIKDVMASVYARRTMGRGGYANVDGNDDDIDVHPGAI